MTAVAADTDWIFRWNITMCYLTNQRCFHWDILTPNNLFQNWNTTETESQKLYLGHVMVIIMNLIMCVYVRRCKYEE